MCEWPLQWWKSHSQGASHLKFYNELCGVALKPGVARPDAGIQGRGPLVKQPSVAEQRAQKLHEKQETAPLEVIDECRWKSAVPW